MCFEKFYSLLLFAMVSGREQSPGLSPLVAPALQRPGPDDPTSAASRGLPDTQRSGCHRLIPAIQMSHLHMGLGSYRAQTVLRGPCTTQPDTDMRS